jgi:hypothetical protein
LISYESEAIGFVKEFLDKTSFFNKIIINPKIVVKNCSEKDVQKAITLAEKYSLIWLSIKSEGELNAEVTIQ